MGKFSCFIALLVLVIASGTSLAATSIAGIDLAKIPKLPDSAFLPGSEFEKLTKLEKEEKPYEDSYIPYEIRIPKDWTDNVQGGFGELKTEKKVLSDSILSILAKYVGPPKNLVRSHILVEAMALSQEVNVRNWFVNFILKNGFTLTSMSEKSPRELEAVYVQFDKDQAYAVRARVIINGPRLMMVRYYLPQENFEEDKNVQAQVIASFTILAPSEERIEKQLEYGFLDQSYFNYPASWALNAKPIYSIERMSAQLYQTSGKKDDEVLDGQIRISVVSKLLKTSLADEVKNFRDKTDIKGYTIGKLIESVEYKYDPSIRSGKAQAYELLPKEKNTMKAYEFLVTIMEGDDFYYITSMISPSRTQEFYVWAANMEVAKIVNESMRRRNIKVDPNDPYFDYLKE